MLPVTKIKLQLELETQI